MSEIVRVGGPRKTYRKKRTWRPKKDHGKIQKLQKEVSAIKRSLKQDVEVKNYDATFASTLIDWNGALTTNMFAPTAGTGQTGRIGVDCTITGMEFRFTATANATAASTLRVLLVVDKKNALTAVNTFLQPSLLGTPGAPLAFYNRNFRNDFTVLYDKVIDFDYSTGNTSHNFVAKSNKKIKVVFDNTSALCNEGAIKLVFVSNITAAGPRPTVLFEGRMYYTDM